MTDEAVWNAVKGQIQETWDKSIIPCMEEYIKIENQSREYDPEWQTNGLLPKAMDLLEQWVRAQALKNAKMTMVPMEGGRTPFMMIEVEGTEPVAKSVLMYGHMDKQPPMEPWSEGLGPYKPVLRDGKLYGRGGADDGYSVCAAVTAVKAMQDNNVPHGRVVIVIEGDEESGSQDLPFYIQHFAKQIGDVDLVVCLDSGSHNYSQAWLTSSLRGYVEGILNIEVMAESMHSGMGGGVCPDVFRILRILLQRVEDINTGRILIPEFHSEIPEAVKQDMAAVNDLGAEYVAGFPLLPGVQPAGSSNLELALNNAWRPCLTVTGQDGLPRTNKAGNVIRTAESFKLSIRVPPGVNSAKAVEALKQTLEANPPYNARVTLTKPDVADGWAAPPMADWLRSACKVSSEGYFGKSFGLMGIGGSIPFMGMLGELFPKAQFCVTGVLGPKSNAHGPDEFLHVEFGKGITYFVTRVVHEHFKHIVRK